MPHVHTLDCSGIELSSSKLFIKMRMSLTAEDPEVVQLGLLVLDVLEWGGVLEGGVGLAKI